MFFSSLFFICFPLIVAIYYVVPNKVKKLYLLAISYLFYILMIASPVYMLIGITLISFLFAEMIKKIECVFGRRCLLGVGIVGIVACMIFARNNSLFAVAGMSFYGLQAISYMVDVYMAKVSTETNLLSYMLYISFFPKILSGPIERFENFAGQISELPQKISYGKLRHACYLCAWGYFEKIVVADHAALIVNNVFDDMYNNHGMEMLVAAIIYAIQLYADFDGYTHIALGTAEMLGISLTSNFKQPYFAKSIKGFWSRWHCSLSSWLKDYIYIPLGGNRKGKVRQAINLLITFLISGLWHGRGMKFIFWGILHGFYQIGERILERWKLPEKKFIEVIRVAVTFMMVDFAWIFFRADSLRSGLFYCYRMITDISMWQVVLLWERHFKVDSALVVILLLGMLILFIVDFMQYRNVSLAGWIIKQRGIVRWSFYYAFGVFILCAWLQTYGVDVGNFIYAKF